MMKAEWKFKEISRRGLAHILLTDLVIMLKAIADYLPYVYSTNAQWSGLASWAWVQPHVCWDRLAGTITADPIA